MVDPKPKRIVNNKLIKEVRKQPCAICGTRIGIDVHHIISRGAQGDDVPDNLLPLCRRDHQTLHQYGISKMIERYPHFAVVLKKKHF